MKIKLFLIIFIAGFLSVNAQSNPDSILGKWLDHTKNATVEIYKSEGKYYGKIILLKEPNDKYGNPRKDRENINSKLRHRKLLGLEVLSGLEFTNNNWVNGKIYSINRGRETNCKLFLPKTNELQIDIETRFITKTIKWTRL